MSQPSSSPKPLPRTKPPSSTPMASPPVSKEGSKPSPPPVSPKPATSSRQQNLTPVKRSNSYRQQPLIQQVIMDSSLKRSSSVDEKLHTTANHPLEKSAVAGNNRLSSPIPSSPKFSSQPSLLRPSSMPSLAGQGTSGSESTQLSAEAEQSSLLSLFLEKRQQDLPLRVKVTSGHHGISEHDAISIGDVFNLHFLKQTTVIEIENDSRHKYYIPWDSAVQVSIPYQGNLKADGFTVSDLISSSKPPLLMKALNSYQCGSPKHSVEEDEVFVVECNKTKTLSQHIKVFSITHQVAKKLKTDCSTSFTTNVSLYMTDVVKHLTKRFPLRAVLYFENNVLLPKDLSRNEVTFLKRATRSTVVASQQDAHSEGSSILEIPIHTDILVSEIHLDENGKRALCALTQNIHADTSRVEVLLANGEIGVIQKGHDEIGNTPGEPASLESFDALEPDEDEYDYVFLSQTKESTSSDEDKTPTADISGLWVQLHAMRRTVETMQAQTNTAEGLSRNTKIQVASLRNEILELKTSLVALEKVVTDKLEFVMHKIQSQESNFAGMVQSKLNNECTGGAQQTPLEILDCTQVLDLLKKMGLEQYQETFRSEMVTGEVLAECDEDVLQHELGISSKIHRIRLMKIIRGKSVTNLNASAIN